MLRRTLPMMLALAAAALPAAAQDRLAVLPTGETVQGALTAADSTGTSYGWVKAYRFQADTGRAYRLTARSDIATGLGVVKPAGVLFETMAWAMFSDGSAMLSFVPPEPAWYYVVVSGPGTTEFTLRADVITAVAAVPRPLNVGDRVPGRLGEQSSIQPGAPTENYRYDLYTFQARRGQDLLLQASGPVWPSFGRMREGRFQAPDPQDTLNTQTRLRVAEDGEHAVLVRGETHSGGVEYVLRVREWAEERREPRRLEAGRDVPGTYDVMEAVAVGDVTVEPWVVSTTPGANLVVTLRSAEFDTYLHVGRVQDGSFVEVAGNDDMGGVGGTDSRVTIPTGEGGDYVIWVRPYGGSGGAYTLRADVRQIKARADTRAVRWGAPLPGTLDESDAVVEDGTPYDAWTFSATAGQRITLTLRSTDFDAYLSVGRMEDGEWMELSSKSTCPVPPIRRIDSGNGEPRRRAPVPPHDHRPRDEGVLLRHQPQQVVLRERLLVQPQLPVLHRALREQRLRAAHLPRELLHLRPRQRLGLEVAERADRHPALLQERDRLLAGGALCTVRLRFGKFRQNLEGCIRRIGDKSDWASLEALPANARKCVGRLCKELLKRAVAWIDAAHPHGGNNYKTARLNEWKGVGR
jgi:hypothetical protein